MKPIIIIPSRLQSTRLSNKPLALINGLPMIAQVIKRALESKIADVLVATTEQKIMDIAQDYKVEAILTDPDLPSGSDRIQQALSIFDKNHKYDTIINLQGDLPTINPQSLQAVLSILKTKQYDIATLGALINKHADKINPNIVKVALSFKGEIAQALYFSRASIPWGSGEQYHHIGLYAYTKEALANFTSLSPSPLEISEKLEQLRALEHGMKIGFKVVDTVPIGVDTQADLILAENYIIKNQL